jgi:hypothetical protein
MEVQKSHLSPHLHAGTWQDANSPRSKAVADDLVQRLRMFAKKPQALSTDVARASVLGEAADALVRKDAEIAAANAEIDELVRALKLCTQRTKRAEARVREAPVATVGGGKLYGCYVEADVPTEWRGKPVALVLLDTEEGGSG